MGIDLNTSEGRKQYLTEKLDDLLVGINDSYGVVLMEELLDRLELTIKDFNDEVKILCDQLVKKQEERQHLMNMLTSDNSDNFKIIDIDDHNNPESKTKIDKDDYNDQEKNIPAWERKLSKLEKK